MRVPREDQTSTEALLWRQLRGRRFHGYKFRRQYTLGHWIADFSCPEQKLVVEIDGGDHWMRKEKDQLRDAQMQGDGFIVLRFNNRQIRESLDWVLENILVALDAERQL